MTPPRNQEDRVSKLAQDVAECRGEIKGLATAAQVTELATTVREMREENTRQHSTIRDALFNPDIPTSLQSQITAINERAFSDNPVSLRSRVGELEGISAIRKARAVIITTLAGGVGTAIAWFKDDILAWFQKH